MNEFDLIKWQLSQLTQSLDICMNEFDLIKWQLSQLTQSLDICMNEFDLIKWQLSQLTQSCFYDICMLTSFSLLAITLRGVSNKHCLLPFFITVVYIMNGDA